MTRPPNAPDPSFAAELDRCLDRVADSFEEAELGARLEQELSGLRAGFAGLAARLRSKTPAGPAPKVLRLRGPRPRSRDAQVATPVLLLQGAESSCVGELFADLGEAVRVGEWRVQRASPERTTLVSDALEVELRPERERWCLEVRAREGRGGVELASAEGAASSLRLHDGREERAPIRVEGHSAVFDWTPRPGDRLELRSAGAGSAWSLPIGGESAGL